MSITRYAFAFAALMALILGPTSTALAIPPDLLTHYELLPRFSTLHQTGGFAGFEVDYRLTGEYDFLEEWQGGDPSAGLRLTARFDNADITGRQVVSPGDFVPTFPIIDVDAFFNIEGLRGELLPLGAPFDVYRFEGRINDVLATSPSEFDSTIELFAALIGPWMYLYGETAPPVGGADFFEYEIRALARHDRWADWNEDGRVDAADYTVARDAGDNVMLADWQSQFGESVPDRASMEAMMNSAFSTTNAIPEPTTLLLAMLAITPALRSRRFVCRL